MNRFLVDTNVIPEFVRPRPDKNVIAWLDATEPKSLFASVVSFGEIRIGIENLPVGKRRVVLEEWFAHGLPEWFDSNLLPVTKTIGGPLGATYD